MYFDINLKKSLENFPITQVNQIMQKEFLAVPKDWTVKNTLNFLKAIENVFSANDMIYIIDPKNKKLISEISYRNLILANSEDNIIHASKNEQPITITNTTNRREIAKIFCSYNLLSIPIINNKKHIIGVVTIYDVRKEISQEIKFQKENRYQAQKIEKPYFQTTIFQMLKKRAGWLCLLFLGEMLTTSAMQYFENKLEKAIILTLFIPLIMSSGGNSGSQGTSLIIRALALCEIDLKDWWKIAIKEVITGLYLGIIIGSIGFLHVLVWQYSGIYNYSEHWCLIGLTIFLTLVTIITISSLVGSMCPFLLKLIRCDPASASAPFVATFVDVTGIIMYFSIAIVVLSGSVL